MSIQALSEFTRVSRYAKFNKNELRRETWHEMVDRVFEDTHAVKYKEQLASSEEFRELFAFAKDAVLKKDVLGAQRLLQFSGDAIFKHNAKVYNCSYGYIDRLRAFPEALYLSLCGVGVGFSVQKHHVAKLPPIAHRTKTTLVYTIDDSIEGWADSIGVLLNSYFVDTSDEKFGKYSGHTVHFDYSLIRPEGSLIAGQFKAPGPTALKAAHEKIVAMIDTRLSIGQTRLEPIDCYDLIMHFADAVLSGGVRRSACICLFGKDDSAMMNAKTGNWYVENPQRARSNNSVLLVRDQCTREEFAQIMLSTRQCGEPGFIFSSSTEIGFNPCVEVSMYPVAPSGKSGFQFCNLTEQNGRHCTTPEKFYGICKASAIVGTMQAGYTDFTYLGEETKQITEREALLGCSITGMMDNPDILFDPEVQRKGAEIVKYWNEKVAAIIRINPAARLTVVKPAGSTSCLLGTASGIHPHHAKRYFRRVQGNRNEFPMQVYKRLNPLAVETSVWSSGGTDEITTFLCEVPKGAIVKNKTSAVQLLEKVRLTQQNWIKGGTVEERCAIKGISHNVSNTISVKDSEWADVEQYIYDNRDSFAGISLLGAAGDKDYPQAPFCTVYSPSEIVEHYGDGSLMASGIIVRALNHFGGDLWKACNTLMHTPESEDNTPEQLNWIRQALQFANRYFNSDVKLMTYCLKDVHNWKLWCDIKREHVEIKWDEHAEYVESHVSADTLAAQGCSGGKCEIV
jgi:ribonucleoside-triphosphate reductase